MSYQELTPFLLLSLQMIPRKTKQHHLLGFGTFFFYGEWHYENLNITHHKDLETCLNIPFTFIENKGWQKQVKFQIMMNYWSLLELIVFGKIMTLYNNLVQFCSNLSMPYFNFLNFESKKLWKYKEFVNVSITCTKTRSNILFFH